VKKYIVDASVIVTSFSDQSGNVNRKFRSLLNEKGGQLISTVFLDFEVANAIRFLDKDTLKIKKYLDAFFGLPIKKVGLSAGQIQEIVNMSVINSTTVYDTSYHFLAISMDGVFVTCDRDYFQKSKYLGYIEYLG